MAAPENKKFNGSDNEQRILLFFALRYALERNSTAGYTVKSIIQKNLHFFNDNDKKQIIKDLNDAISKQDNYLEKSIFTELKEYIEANLHNKE